ncbi:hypothetical protein GDO78_017117 [Eleutherodactylus coqui]|nr:hypothetical protein GDO78_017117 [Eleutherodactylus coqui]
MNAYSVTKPAPCPKNMTSELDCAPCRRYCNENNYMACAELCRPPKECYCEPGYVYLKRGLQKCVLPQDCPK